VGATLSELEHKLRELELELSAVRRHPPAMSAPGAAAAPPPASHPSAVPEPAPVRLVDEGLEPAGEAAPAADPPPPGDVGFARYPTVAASEPALEPPAAPPDPAAGAAQLVANVRGRMAEVAEQLEELMLLRRELELRAHELEHVAQPPAAEPLPAAVGWPRPESLSPMPTPAPAPPPAGAATGEAAWFEGHVEVDAGPFADIAALGDFELKLARLPQVAAARVRGYGANRALIDVHLRGPAVLAGELRAVWGTGFTVLEAQAGRLSLVLDPAPAPDRWG
jgi:hypothetical protein